MKSFIAVALALVVLSFCTVCVAECPRQQQAQLQSDVQVLPLVAPAPLAAGVVQTASTDRGNVSNRAVSNRSVSNQVSNRVSNRSVSNRVSNRSVSNRSSNGVSNRKVSNRAVSNRVSNGVQQVQVRQVGLINISRR